MTFNVKKDELLLEDKLQTIRANVELWEGRYLRSKQSNGSKKLDVWWKSPRTMHINKDCYKMGIANWTVFFKVRGKRITDDLSKKDGFNDKEELLTVLEKRNKMTRAQVLNKLWVVIRWRWTTGPFTQEEAKTVWER